MVIRKASILELYKMKILKKYGFAERGISGKIAKGLRFFFVFSLYPLFFDKKKSLHEWNKSEIWKIIIEVLGRTSSETMNKIVYYNRKEENEK